MTELTEAEVLQKNKEAIAKLQPIYERSYLRMAEAVTAPALYYLENPGEVGRLVTLCKFGMDWMLWLGLLGGLSIKNLPKLQLNLETLEYEETVCAGPTSPKDNDA